jgi:hypothetical protein
MIRIRYQGSNELSPGLHATAVRDGRRTTVYLLDGMTAVQRRSALRRLRLTARMGHCPRLPAAQLAFALFTDRIRTGIGRAGAVLRLHPAGSTVPIMVLSGGAIAFLLFSTVSIHVLHNAPRTADQSAAGGSPVASASAIPANGGSQGQATGQGGPGGTGNPADPGGTGVRAEPGGPGGGSDPGQLTQPGRNSSGRVPALAAGGGGGGGTSAGSGGRSGSDTGTTGQSSGGSTSGGTTLSGGSDPSQVPPRQSTPATSAPAPAPASTAPATAPAKSGPGSGSSSGSPGNGVCVNVGPLGVCLSI